MVAPIKFVVACPAADEMFVIVTIPDEQVVSMRLRRARNGMKNSEIFTFYQHGDNIAH